LNQDDDFCCIVDGDEGAGKSHAALQIAYFLDVDSYELTELENPDTGEPYDASTISRDLSELEDRWRERAMAEVSEHKAEQLSELRTARRAAWRKGDYAEVRRNLQAEMDLLGTKAPQRQEITGAEGGPIQLDNAIVVREYLDEES